MKAEDIIEELVEVILMQEKEINKLKRKKAIGILPDVMPTDDTSDTEE